MTISVLVLARKGSRFLRHFLHNFFSTVSNTEKTELLVMAAVGDSFNKDLFSEYEGRARFFFEDRKLGGNGRHLLFQDLLQHATGDWVMPACDDHHFIMQGWDNHFRSLASNQGFDSKKIHLIVPRFENTGNVGHLLSRGYLSTTGRFGDCGNIDSWINTVWESLPNERVIVSHDNMMKDYTHCPEKLLPDGVYHDGNQDTSNGDGIPHFGHPSVNEEMKKEISKLMDAINGGGL